MSDEKKICKVTVLLEPTEFEHLDSYCGTYGYKKSTLISRLVRDHLSREGYWPPATSEPEARPSTGEGMSE